jgi:DNA sulfur modification protein DndB
MSHKHNSNTSEPFTYQFPAIRGIQAGKEYYVIMCPLKLIPKIFLFDESEIPPQMRAQRTLNHARIPAIANYILTNPEDYVFSAITASIDGKVHFNPLGDRGEDSKVGSLIVPMSSRFIINDGQHRRAAIEEALKSNPGIGMETISVVFFIDNGLKKSQQMFADLNKHAVQPTKSLGILYDNRDPLSRLVLNVVEKTSVFKGFTDFEKTTISNRSIKMFTLSSIYQGTKELLGKDADFHKNSNNLEELTIEYWTEVAKNIPEWQLIIDRKISSSELRRDYIHAHGIALHALGRLGNSLVLAFPNEWSQKLKNLKNIDWSKTNTSMWEGRAMLGARINKSHVNLILTTNILKTHFGINLSEEEQKIESKFIKGR